LVIGYQVHLLLTTPTTLVSVGIIKVLHLVIHPGARLLHPAIHSHEFWDDVYSGPLVLSDAFAQLSVMFHSEDIHH